MCGLVNVIPFATGTEAFFLGELAGRKFESHPKHGLFLSFFITFLLSRFFFPHWLSFPRRSRGERGNLFEFLFQIISSSIITFSAFFSYSSPVGLGSRSEFQFNSSRRPRKLKFLQRSFEQLQFGSSPKLECKKCREDWKLLKLFRIAPRTIKRLELEEKSNDRGKEQEDFNIILEKRDEKERNKKRNEESSPDPSAKNIGGAERFAQRVEINRRPSSFNGPSPPPLFLQRLGINPGSGGRGDY